MNRFHSGCISAFCSLMLSSAFLGSSAGPRLAAIGAAGVRALASEVKTLPETGWEGVSQLQVANALENVPAPGPVVVENKVAKLTKNEYPLAPVRDSVLKTEEEGKLSGVLCTLLGLTENNEALEIKQIKVDNDSTMQWVSVSLKTKEDLILSYRSKDNSWGVFYRTTSSGVLIKAVSAKKGESPKELSLADAQAGFDREKSFWINRASSADVASYP